MSAAVIVFCDRLYDPDSTCGSREVVNTVDVDEARRILHARGWRRIPARRLRGGDLCPSCARSAR